MSVRGLAAEQSGLASALRGNGGMAAKDEGGEGISQLSFPGGPGPGGEAGTGEPLLTESGERSKLLI